VREGLLPAYLSPVKSGSLSLPSQALRDPGARIQKLQWPGLKELKNEAAIAPSSFQMGELLSPKET
jgi:hypothetical protein